MRTSQAVDRKNAKDTSPGFDHTAYERRSYLTEAELMAMERKVSHPRGKHSNTPYEYLEDLLHPVEEILKFMGCSHKYVHYGLRWHLVRDMYHRRRAYWGWSQQEWVETIESCHERCKAFMIVVAYLLGELEGLQALGQAHRYTELARRAFGRETVEASLSRVGEVVEGWGYNCSKSSWTQLSRVVCQTMVVARSPRLEDLTMEDLKPILSFDRDAPRAYAALFSRVLASMGIVHDPILRYQERRNPHYRGPSPEEAPETRCDEEGNSVPEEWLSWCRRWIKHSTLRNRRGLYLRLLKAGRWLATHHPQVVSPKQWDAELAVEYVAAVDRMETGDFAPDLKKRNPGYSGKPLKPNSKASHLYAARTFFKDLQQWEWMPIHFNPDRYLQSPPSVVRLLGADPRTIDTGIWAKLVKAGLELRAEDFSSGHPYPIEMNRALAALWVCVGLRSDEIFRLRAECVRWQDANSGSSGGRKEASGERVCFLDVPVNKTGSAFTKPVPAVVGERIAEWERLRPKDQRPAVGETTGGMEHFLFSYRNRRLPKGYLNNTLIPALCYRAGVPQHDARGRITSHRARATIASQLYNGPEPWTITEIQAFLGHTDPKSTQHYLKVDPTKLAEKYANSGYLEKNLATVEVLLDVEALANGEGKDALYYDLGHGLCSNPYWAQCPYRMACVKCPMYVPGEEAQYIKAREGIRRMLETVPMTDEEKRTADGDQQAINELLSKKQEVPIPAERSPQEQPIVPLTKKKERKF